MPCRYEGTGRSLSLKLIQQLRSEGAKLSSGQDGQGSAGLGRTFREVQLQEPIRCAATVLSFLPLPRSACTALTYIAVRPWQHCCHSLPCQIVCKRCCEEDLHSLSMPFSEDGVMSRYGAGDKVEAWLNDLLCLDAAEHIPPPPPQLPHPSDCELYYVERDTLFSYHKVLFPILAPSVPGSQCHHQSFTC